jgi:uncharacterized protein (TIGR03437 family)
VIRALALFFILAANLVHGGSVQLLPALPSATTPKAVQVDSAGNIYVAGWFYAAPPALPVHAFVAKLSPDGSKVLWRTALAGTGDDRIQAMTLGADNSVYVTGTTASTDFPTTPGSMQPTTTVTTGQAFAAKLNSSGVVVYSTYVGGTNPSNAMAIAVDASGHAFITGFGVSSIPNDSAYVTELNASGSAVLLTVAGFGGWTIAVDTQGNIYTAGAFTAPVAPTTPDAFQSGTFKPLNCFSGFTIGFTCTYQHVAKIDPTGKLIYATYLAGAYGAMPSAIAVDAAGNAIVAGSTNSPDYPTTPTAYQPEYSADPEVTFQPPHDSVAPVPAGYVSKLNASGTALLWSTLLSGSASATRSPADFSNQGDTITSMALDAAGNILVSGAASSSDFPGLWSTPVASRPVGSGVGFVTRLSPDGTTLSSTQLIPGSVTAVNIALRNDGSVVSVGNSSNVVSGVSDPIVAAVSLSPVGRIAAIADTADSAKIVRVAPGQLLTLYGTNLAPQGSAPASTQFPVSLNGVSVTFSGIAAPILYTSGIQINLQVPYEVAGLTEVTMQVSAPSFTESYILAVAARQPSVFVFSNSFSQPLFDVASCNGQTVSGLQPLALNADGTLNSCANPAASGSVVTLFLNGLGVSAPKQATGTISTSAVALNPAVSFVVGSPSATNFLSTATLPGSIDSIAQVQVQVSTTQSFLTIPLGFAASSPDGGYWVRGPSIIIWVRPSN